MIRTLKFENDYPASADRLFDLVTDLDTLYVVTRPWLQFEHLPSGPVTEGQEFDVAISLFGWLPERPYRMRVARCDPQAREMVSEESGAGIFRLTHTLKVRERSGGARLIDRIDIDAGWKTPVVAWAGWFTFRWRHHRRLRLLQGDQP